MQSKKHLSNLQIQKWIKEGRGQGQGATYKPWLTVRDFGSEGRSHRIFGHKSQRIYHLFFDLELTVFLLLERHSSTLDIREQFPLQLNLTSELVESNSIRHPAYRGALQVMTTDFVVNCSDLSRPKFAIQVKYSSDLEDARTIEKLELERRYWHFKQVPWMIMTEKQIPKAVLQNINWLYPASSDDFDLLSTLEKIKFYDRQFIEHPDLSIIEVAKKLDMTYENELGQSLLDIRRLLAQRYFSFNITLPFRTLKGQDLKLIDDSLHMEMHRVSNQ